MRAVGDGCNEGEDSRRDAGDPLEVEAAALGDRDKEGDMGGETSGRYADEAGATIEYVSSGRRGGDDVERFVGAWNAACKSNGASGRGTKIGTDPRSEFSAAVGARTGESGRGRRRGDVCTATSVMRFAGGGGCTSCGDRSNCAVACTGDAPSETRLDGREFGKSPGNPSEFRGPPTEAGSASTRAEPRRDIAGDASADAKPCDEGAGDIEALAVPLAPLPPFFPLPFREVPSLAA